MDVDMDRAPSDWDIDIDLKGSFKGGYRYRVWIYGCRFRYGRFCKLGGVLQNEFRAQGGFGLI